MTEPDFSTIQGIVFDLDDTLYPQVEFKRSGFRGVGTWLEECGIAHAGAVIFGMERIIKRFGPSHPRMFDELVAETGLDEGLIPEMVEIFRANDPIIMLYPGVRELLAELKDRFKLGLLTDGLASVQRNKVKALGIAELFDEIVYSDERETSKPDPALFAHFEKLWGLEGPQLAHIADNPAKDFVEANRRGWLTVRVLTGEHRDAQAGSGSDARLSVDGLDCDLF